MQYKIRTRMPNNRAGEVFLLLLCDAVFHRIFYFFSCNSVCLSCGHWTRRGERLNCSKCTTSPSTHAELGGSIKREKIIFGYFQIGKCSTVVEDIFNEIKTRSLLSHLSIWLSSQVEFISQDTRLDPFNEFHGSSSWTYNEQLGITPIKSTQVHRYLLYS